MQCSKCQFQNPNDSLYCGTCGKPIEMDCPKCGSTLPPGFNFCNKCGHDLRMPSKDLTKELSFDEKIEKIQKFLPKGLIDKILSQRDRIEGERKLVTVMFCDMVGYTPLSEKLGSEETYSIIDEVYEILIRKVHDYEGTVNELTGDGVMALFGAPVALEDAPLRAIRSSLSIHREMAKFCEKLEQRKKGVPTIRMRIGIHSGPVVVGTVGNDLRIEFKAVGDTVNLASRMEGQAQPGTTYITEETFRLTEGLFRFEGLGQRVIKGKQKPVNVYRVIAPSTRKTRFDVSADRGLTPFVGKERELELLLDGLDRVKSGRGQAFSIIAEAGVGKSRLLYEFRKAVAHEDVTFLEGKCLSYSKGAPYHLHIDALKANFDIIEGDGDYQIREKVKKGIKIVKADEKLTLPYFLELLSVKNSGIDNVSMSSEEIKSRIVEALKQIVLKGSEIRPLILAYEDLHWIDKSSEEVLNYILESIPGARILLIFTYRQEFVHAWGTKSYHNQLLLNRLSNRESLMMAHHLLGTEQLDRNLENFILEKAEGIPFFLEELVKSLENLKIIEKQGIKYQITKDINSVTIPATIQDVIMTRIDSLPDEIKDILQTASAVGREFSHSLIKKVTGFGEQELLTHLSVLKDSELIYERGIYPKSAYIFKHALTQEVAYDSLILKRKEKLHEGIGAAIEALNPERIEEYFELLAYHYARSTNTENALQYLVLANQKAVKLRDLEQAKTYFDEAMACLDILPETEENRQRRISLIVNQEDAFMLLFMTPEYYDLLTSYESSAIELGNKALLGALYSRMGNCEFGFGQLDQGIKTLTKAVDLCEAAGNAEDAEYAYAYLGWSYLYGGYYKQVLAVKEELQRLMKQRFNPSFYVRGICAASRAWTYLGRWDEAVADAQNALNVAEESSDNSLITFATWILMMAYTWKGDLKRAIEYGELADRKAKTTADKGWAQRGLALAQCRAGEPEKGIEVLAEALTTFQSGSWIPSVISTTCTLGEGYWLAGETDKAKQKLEEGLELADSCGARYYVGFTRRLLGEIALVTNPNEAATFFAKSIDVLQEIEAENELALAYVGYGKFHKQQNHIDQAREHLMKAMEIFDRLGTLIEPDKARAELAGLPEH